MILPKISCICPTFSRAYLLEEALESFLRQDYQGEKELIIYNDFAQQEFIFEHPEVKVINSLERSPNLGHKWNVTYSYATGEYLLTWGDDDIHLPSRISRMVNNLNQSDFLFDGPCYILYGDVLHKRQGATQGANIVSRKLFDAVGGMPERNTGEDVEFNAKVSEYLGRPLDVCTAEPQFLYRWSSPRPHISQFGGDVEGQLTSYDIMLQIADSNIESGVEPKGVYHLNPHWKLDWVEEVKNAIIDL
jgi:glycosyltransferase involved in cell wall biosynthesis